MKLCVIIQKIMHLKNENYKIKRQEEVKKEPKYN